MKKYLNQVCLGFGIKQSLWTRNEPEHTGDLLKSKRLQKSVTHKLVHKIYKFDWSPFCCSGTLKLAVWKCRMLLLRMSSHTRGLGTFGTTATSLELPVGPSLEAGHILQTISSPPWVVSVLINCVILLIFVWFLYGSSKWKIFALFCLLRSVNCCCRCNSSPLQILFENPTRVCEA